MGSRSILGVAVLAAFTACKQSRWKAKAATELRIGGFLIPIPAEWRSLTEMNDSEPDFKKLGSNTVGMMPEVNRDGVITASVLLTLEAKSAFEAWSSCEQASERSGSSQSAAGLSGIADVQSFNVGGELGCTWKGNLGELAVTLGRRLVGDQILTVQCMRDRDRDVATEGVCKQALSAVGLSR